MDSEHRHELQENDLQHFLLHFNEWWAKHGTRVLVVLLVLVMCFVGYQYLNTRTQQQREAAWSDLAVTSSPEVFRTVAESYDDPAVRSVAYLRGADLFLAQAVNPDLARDDSADPSATQPAPPATDEDIARWLTEAGAMYQAVVDDPKTHALFKLNARLGLASVAEAKAEWAQAEAIYKAVIEQAGEKYVVITAQAEARLGLLDRVKQPVTFAPDAPPALLTAPTTQPATITVQPAANPPTPPVETPAN